MNVSKFSIVAFFILVWASTQGKLPQVIKAAQQGQIYLIKTTSSNWGQAFLLDK